MNENRLIYISKMMTAEPVNVQKGTRAESVDNLQNREVLIRWTPRRQQIRRTDIKLFGCMMH